MSKSVTQHINAPVYGHVVAGDLTVVENYQHIQAPERQRELTYWDFSVEELQGCLAAERAVRWRAWRRYWFNLPSTALAFFIIGLAAWLLYSVQSGQFFRLGGSAQTPSPFWLIGASTVFMLPLSYWLQAIRRVEANLARHAQNNIDDIEVVLRRRAVHSR